MEEKKKRTKKGVFKIFQSYQQYFKNHILIKNIFKAQVENEKVYLYLGTNAHWVP